MKIIMTILITLFISTQVFTQTADNKFDALIKKCSSISSGDYNCNSYLRLANYVQNLEEPKAIELIKEYAKTGKYEDQIIILSKMLFEAKKDSVLRRPMIGGAAFLGGTDYEDWATEPIEIINNIPILITGGYILGGCPESSLNYLEYCIGNGEWSKNVYTVKKEEELKAGLKTLLNSNKWNTDLTSSNIQFFKKQIN